MPCPVCAGEGFFIANAGLEDEHYIQCACPEICEHCDEPLLVIGGVETCACPDQMGKAA